MLILGQVKLRMVKLKTNANRKKIFIKCNENPPSKSKSLVKIFNSAIYYVERLLYIL